MKDAATWQFWIDVGGTFTDCIARRPDGTAAHAQAPEHGPIPDHHHGRKTQFGKPCTWHDPTRRSPPPAGIFRSATVSCECYPAKGASSATSSRASIPPRKALLHFDARCRPFHPPGTRGELFSGEEAPGLRHPLAAGRRLDEPLGAGARAARHDPRDQRPARTARARARPWSPPAVSATPCGSATRIGLICSTCASTSRRSFTKRWSNSTNASTPRGRVSAARSMKPHARKTRRVADRRDRIAGGLPAARLPQPGARGRRSAGSRRNRLRARLAYRRRVSPLAQVHRLPGRHDRARRLPDARAARLLPDGSSRKCRGRTCVS